MPAPKKRPATATAAKLAAASAPAVKQINEVQAAIPATPGFEPAIVAQVAAIGVVEDNTDPVADFLRHVDVEGDHWLWGGEMSRRGYGVHVVDGVRVNVRRAVHYLFGADHPGLTGATRVEATCGSPGCVHPDHLVAA